ncbi:MAG: regulatory protein RecX [Gemmatimonadetes bacterium]|nr:regulatory protein RecX [Gemmatimonadota bacterium]MBT5329321.1 regulatory protein RecX [Gemmatimonadota bacterium]MBT5450743.1 regulatory protein RecX [Gemmatimonadota bacterium]MBT5800869.1 regulatory protein RecX [Gemmatimonadota bacterium]MBT6621616.1 regulatory protein RecX [Gemmatimonadota bacterium]
MNEQLQKAKDAAYNYLSYRARSVKEVRDKLVQKEFAEEIIEQVVDDLQRQKLLNDREFARRFVEARLGRANGSRKLAQELRRKGIETEIIDEVLGEFAATLDSEERAMGLLGKQAWRYRGLERDKAKRRMLGFLARRGYDAQMARSAVDKVWQELQELEDEVEGS